MRKDKENSSRILLCIATYVGLYGFPPSIRELCMMSGFKTATARRCIKQLEKEDWLSWQPSGTGTIVLKKVG